MLEEFYITLTQTVVFTRINPINGIPFSIKTSLIPLEQKSVYHSGRCQSLSSLKTPIFSHFSLKLAKLRFSVGCDDFL